MRITGEHLGNALRWRMTDDVPMQSHPIVDVPITGEPIRLGQFLKLAGLADDGSTAKELLEADEVTVNGEPEFRRGRQLTSGDIVAVRSEQRRVTLPEA
jgi:ribosome-associated protein